MFKKIVIISSFVFLLQGCVQSTVKSPDQADVTSSPSGATVYANDKKIGVTPLRRKLYEVFPAGWKNAAYQAEGELVVKKDGCEDSSLEVSDSILSKPIHVSLECDKKKPETLTDNTTLSDTEKRLKKVDTLYNKKLITKTEYEATRKRILNEL